MLDVCCSTETEHNIVHVYVKVILVVNSQTTKGLRAVGPIICIQKSHDGVKKSLNWAKNDGKWPCKCRKKTKNECYMSFWSTQFNMSLYMDVLKSIWVQSHKMYMIP